MDNGQSGDRRSVLLDINYSGEGSWEALVGQKFQRLLGCDSVMAGNGTADTMVPLPQESSETSLDALQPPH